MRPSIYLLALTTSIGGAASSHACCSRLVQVLGPKVSLPGEPSYTLVESSYWSLQESSLQPGCIVQPSNPNDVASSLSVISENPGCKFAIKGQGHAPAAGFANIDEGVTIDMTGLNTTELNGDRTVAYIGSGAAWLSVYRYLDSFNVSVAGGRNGLVGVGGLLLGGGISHFTSRVGWACDNVINFEIVLANGVLTNANATSHPDLYRALKGGANNFGVVTRFDLATFEQGAISATNIINDISERTAVFQAFTDIADSSHFDTNTSLVTGLLYNSTSKQWLISNSAVYTEPDVSPPVFKGLSAIPSVSNSSKITTLAALADEEATAPLNWAFATATFRPSTQLLLDIFEILNTTLYSFNPPGGVVWSIAFEPLPSVINTYAKEKGGNVLGLSENDGNGLVVLVSALWPNSSSNDQVDEVAQIAVSKIEHLAAATGRLKRFQYLNYAAPYQNPLSSYGENNLEFLRKVSETYDPQRIMQSRLSGGFRLW